MPTTRRAQRRRTAFADCADWRARVRSAPCAGCATRARAIATRRQRRRSAKRDRDPIANVLRRRPWRRPPDSCLLLSTRRAQFFFALDDLGREPQVGFAADTLQIV